MSSPAIPTVLPAIYTPAVLFPPQRLAAPCPLSVFDITYLHYHRELEFGICIEGSGVCCVDGVGYPFVPGNVQVIFPYQHHLSKSHGTQPSRWYWMNPDLHALMATIGVTDLRPLQTIIDHQMARCGIFSAVHDPEIVRLVSDIVWACHTPDAPLQKCALQIWELMLLLAEQSRDLEKLPLRRSRSLQSVDPALSRIRRAVDDGTSISVAALAADCRMSEPNFRRVFRTAVGLSPHAYLRRCMLHKAEQLLLLTEESVLAISACCGFEDVSGFNRMFRQASGLSPSAYRRRYRKSAELPGGESE